MVLIVKSRVKSANGIESGFFGSFLVAAAAFVNVRILERYLQVPEVSLPLYTTTLGGPSNDFTFEKIGRAHV